MNNAREDTKEKSRQCDDALSQQSSPQLWRLAHRAREYLPLQWKDYIYAFSAPRNAPYLKTLVHSSDNWHTKPEGSLHTVTIDELYIPFCLRTKDDWLATYLTLTSDEAEHNLRHIVAYTFNTGRCILSAFIVQT